MQIVRVLLISSVFLTLPTVALPPVRESCTHAARGALQDIALIHKNLVSWNSYKIVTAVLPLFVLGAMIDKPVHACFYDRHHHRNIHQIDSCCFDFARYGIIFPVFLGGVLSVAARDENLLNTSRMFALGLPFVIAAADIIKAFDLEQECCLRPWHERFSCKHRSSGGFPSGHMALATYAAALYGKRFGMPFAVPLGAYAALVAGCFINGNRHYVSQIIAGAGLGCLYAWAASAATDEKLAWLHKKNMSISIDSLNCRPAINISYRF